jgi:hypothetical protein
MAKRVVFKFEDLDDAGSEEPHAHGDHGGARVGKLSLLSEDPVRGRGGGGGGVGGSARQYFLYRSMIPL